MQALEEEGIRLRNETPGDHKTTCPQCSTQRRNKKDPCLSVTVENDGGAVWNCHHCGWSGGVPGSSYKPNVTQIYTRTPTPPKKVEEPKDKTLPDEVLRWFKSRGIGEMAVAQLGIFRTEKSFGGKPEGCIAFPYKYKGETVNIKYRTKDKRFRQEGGSGRTLYNIDRVLAHWEISNTKEVIFCEGEMDVAAFYEAGIDWATTLPDGAPNQTKFDPHDKRFDALLNCEEIQEAERVLIATDADGPGQNLALELIHRFGKDRCFTVKFPTSFDVKCKDANEVLQAHGKEVLGECIDNAEPFPIEGLYTVKDYKSQVLDIFHGRTQQPLSTGFPLFDQIYKVMPGTFNLVTGVPNHGKSNFMDQLAINMAKNHNWKFAIFSPEHSTANHIRRLSEKVVSKPFDVGPNERMVEDELHQAMEFLDDRFFFIESHDRIPSIDWLLSKARGAILRHGVRGIIVDPYNEIDASREGGKREDEHIRDLISACKQFVRRHEIAMWMVAHPAKMQRQPDGIIPPPTLYDVSGSAHWNNMTDVGLVVHRDFEKNETRVITRKVREQGLYGSIGEAFFRYNLSTHCYEEVSQTAPTEYSRASSGFVSRHWTDND